MTDHPTPGSPLSADDVGNVRDYWSSFCDCDWQDIPDSVLEGFADRLVSVGLAEYREADEDDLADPFAHDRGIEKGGSVLHLTALGRLAYKADADGWIAWSGGENPVGDTPVNYRVRSGSTFALPQEVPASALRGWIHAGWDTDIIAFRLPTAEADRRAEGVSEEIGEEYERAAATVSLAECPPGLFWWNGSLGFKSEYGAMEAEGSTWKVGNRPDAYCADSGEFFWGGAKTHEDRARVQVYPVSADAVSMVASHGPQALSTRPADADKGVDAGLKAAWRALEKELPDSVHDGYEDQIERVAASVRSAAAALEDAAVRERLDARRLEAQRALTRRAEARAADLLKAAEEFCHRVEAGEIKSKRSYAAFKAALAAAPRQPQGAEIRLLEATRLLRAIVETPNDDYDAASQADQIKAFLNATPQPVQPAPVGREAIARIIRDRTQIGGTDWYKNAYGADINAEELADAILAALSPVAGGGEK